jgi:saccharopine dehydrogenase (NAD+, L-lysine forming)
MSDAILIVGGYGTVGTVIASTLAQHHENQLIIAGRNETRAIKLAAELGSGVRWRMLDVTQPLDYEALLADVRYVVMCLDLPDLEFVRQCFQRGIHYIDISAEYPILAAIAELNGIAREHGATAVLSVGLVPGLSNLMARRSLRFMEKIEHFDSAILAGLGEKHGVAGSAWILNHMGDSSGKARFHFREPYGQKTVHRFAFSDQYTLPQTLPIAQAATWLGFDSFFMTQLIGLARLPILRHLFQQNAIKQFLLNTTQRWQFGSDEFVLTTRACGAAGRYQAWLRAKREASVTGLVAAEVVHQMMIEQLPAGVFHIEQLFELEEFLPLLEQHGATFFETDKQLASPSR